VRRWMYRMLKTSCAVIIAYLYSAIRGYDYNDYIHLVVGLRETIASVGINEYFGKLN
jgi:hypothetical protein